MEYAPEYQIHLVGTLAKVSHENSDLDNIGLVSHCIIAYIAILRSLGYQEQSRRSPQDHPHLPQPQHRQV